MNNTTIVTGLWDLGRGSLTGWANRDFEHYKNNFFKLLKTQIPMVIYIPSSLLEDVKNIREGLKTHIIIKEVEDFKTWNPFYKEINEIRTSDEWRSTAGWLSESPQGGLEFYNPMMFTKVFMVNDACIINPFKTDYFYWIDGGLTNTVPEGYFLHDNVLDKIEDFSKSIDNKIIHLGYRYTGNNEIHGFKRDEMAKLCKVDFVDIISRGGFFGGHKNKISEYNRLYYSIMESTLKSGYMGADESLFTILRYRHPELIYTFMIEENGLVWPFFEMLKSFDRTKVNLSELYDGIGLYVLTYNSPNQFETLCKSIELYDKNFLEKTTKFLVNNSLNKETFEQYDKLCEKYNFTEIHKDNIGICGGRQFIAEHAEESRFKYHFFFEDDMFFYNGEKNYCKNGFRRKVEELFDISLEIMEKEKFDFLKYNFTEFFGDNSRQWSWHNIPSNVREKLFPENPIKDENNNTPPFLRFSAIKSHKNIPYATGEIFYCNWPQIVSNEGNKKLFLETKWEHPFEQTWMSYIYQETVDKKIFPGILLLTPTEHDRFDHYSREERREN